MKAQDLNKYVVASDEARDAFLGVEVDVLTKLNKAVDNMEEAKVLVSDSKEVFEYGLRVGQYMTLIEISTGIQMDKKEDGDIIEPKVVVRPTNVVDTDEFKCPDKK